ncbi:M23 family metallopeptidase [Herminiimonas sp. CN]|uniref:M23 family metallopeptidase n=1 Tax=Herminiimonas sp. CN TaxID=1349818 RepID=UPI000473EDE7|nr:M23 family metallopeptidase [Herminiimonas sp. CN]
MQPNHKYLSLDSARRLVSGTSRKTRIISATALFLTACAFGAIGVAPLAPDASDLPVNTIEQQLALPNLAQQIAALEQSAPQYFMREEKVRAGDTLATLLGRLGINDAAAVNFIQSDSTARSVLQLHAGKRVQVQTADDGRLQWLRTQVASGRDSPARNLLIARNGNNFKAAEETAAVEMRVEMRSGRINSSLFAATDSADIPDPIASQMVDMFSTDIDFASDLRKGDRFNVIYETYWQNGELVRTGRVLAGEFVNDGTTYQSVWFQEPGSKQGGGYYGFDGKSLKKAFLKSPLEFSRISSGFSMRKHPILGQWKQHKGVDFAAPTGTPIRASGDGVLDFVGTQNGYGNFIVIKHWSNYSTAYGHMSRFAPGMHKGSKVSQGDVIGYVGATGWATGPHLHYEFRVSNEALDPMSVNVPNAQPMTAAQLQQFRKVTGDIMHRFALLRQQDNPVKLALAR